MTFCIYSGVNARTRTAWVVPRSVMELVPGPMTHVPRAMVPSYEGRPDESSGAGESMDEVGLSNVVIRVIVGMLLVFNLFVSVEAVTVDQYHYWAVNGMGIAAICAIFIISRAVFRKKKKARHRR